MYWLFSHVCAVLTGCVVLCLPAFAQSVESPSVVINTGMSKTIDTPVAIRRVALSSSDVAEVVVATPRQILLNGKKAGGATLVIWMQDGSERLYDVIVTPRDSPLLAIRRQLEEELPGQIIKLELVNSVPILSGTVTDLRSGQRALALAGILGKPVDLLDVEVPDTEPQILLKIRFADVDRSVSKSLGMNLFSNGLGHTIGSTSTQQFSAPGFSGTQGGSQGSGSSAFSLSNVLNIFLYRTDLNLGATIEALESRNLLQILAEPNVLALNNQPASFLAGGQFPFPMLQGGGAGLGAVTIAFKEFGIRLNFVPSVTPRGTIQLTVSPEVSSLDYSNALTIQGYTIPALSTKRVSTEVELESGQSFAIAGLLDNQVTQSLDKVPGLSSIPLLGKMFESRQNVKSNTELLIVVTPEIVNPIAKGKVLPDVQMPEKFLPSNSQGQLTNPAGSPQQYKVKPIPMEELLNKKDAGRPPSDNTQQTPSLQFVPMMTTPGQTNAPNATAAPSSAPGVSQ